MKTILSVLLAAAFASLAIAQSPLADRKLMPAKQETGLVAVPTSAGTIATTDIRLTQLSIYNRTSSAVTATVCDRQSTARCILDTVTSIAAGQHLIIYWPEGLLMKSGMTWLASASGVEGSIVTTKP